jgi:O-antigen/teichoic acid export membrane protein
MLKYTKDILKSSPFLRRNAVLFTGSMIVAFLNYLYYPVLGRLLPTESFGELQVAISLLMQMTTLLSVLSLVSINILVSQKNEKEALRTINELEKVAIYASLLILILTTALSPFIQAQLKFDSSLPIIAIAGVFLSMIPLSFRTAYLRARNDFTGTSISGAISALAKLILSMLLVIAGLKAFGAVAGILLAQIVAIIYTSWRARKLFYVRTKSSRRPDWKLLKPQFRYGLFVLIVSSLVVLQISVDATIVKYLFSPEEAGAYAGIATVARIVFFLAGATAAVMLSAVSYTRPMTKNRSMLKKSLLLTSVLSGSAALFFCLFPTLTLHLLLGARYDVYAGLLPILSITIFITSVGNLLSTYLIALHRYIALIPVILGTLASIVSLIVAHSTIHQVIVGLLIGSSTMTLGLALVAFWPTIRLTRLKDE